MFSTFALFCSIANTFFKPFCVISDQSKIISRENTAEQTWMLWKKSSVGTFRLSDTDTRMEDRWQINKKIQSDIHNRAFIIERPLLVKSCPKLLHVVAIVGRFVCNSLQWYLIISIYVIVGKISAYSCSTTEVTLECINRTWFLALQLSANWPLKTHSVYPSL